MPPSGFKQPAINGLLVFVRDCYSRTLEEHRGSGLPEDEVLAQSMSRLEQMAQATGALGISAEGQRGLADFLKYNFSDLREEIAIGKKELGYAMETEIAHIDAYLARFKLPKDIEAIRVAPPLITR